MKDLTKLDITSFVSSIFVVVAFSRLVVRDIFLLGKCETKNKIDCRVLTSYD